jgi:hypothetical protein
VFRLQAPTEALSGDLDTDVAIINREVERIILQCPQQYLWGYNRYKGPRRGARWRRPGVPRRTCRVMRRCVPMAWRQGAARRPPRSAPRPMPTAPLRSAAQ